MNTSHERPESRTSTCGEDDVDMLADIVVGCPADVGEAVLID
jgi:hypothetical protein